MRLEDRAGGGVPVRLPGPGEAFPGGGHHRAPRRGLREDPGGPGGHPGGGHPQRPAGALPVFRALPDLGRLPGPALLRHLPPVAEVPLLLPQLLSPRAVRGGGHPPPGDAPRGSAAQGGPGRRGDALPGDGGDAAAVLPLRGAAGGGPAGSPVPLRHGEHRGGPGAGGHRGVRRAGGGPLPDGGGPHRHRGLRRAPAVRAPGPCCAWASCWPATF